MAMEVSKEFAEISKKAGRFRREIVQLRNHYRGLLFGQTGKSEKCRLAIREKMKHLFH